MWDMMEHLGVSLMLGLLHKLKVDPTRVGAFKTVLIEVMTGCCELLGVQPPIVP
jgi:hypothetical protein